MHFVAPKNIIEKALKNVLVSVQQKVVIPMLGCVKVVASEGKVAMTTTNLDTQTSDVIFCNVHTNGTIAVPLTTLVDIVKTMPSKSEIDFKIEDNGKNIMTISSGKRVFEIVCLVGNDFPDTLSGNLDLGFKAKSSDVLNMLKKVSFAMSSNPERYNLNGIYIESKNTDGKNFLCAVATDGHRLSLVKLPLKDNIELSGRILPRKAVIELVKLLDDDAECTLSFSENKAGFEVNNVKFATKLLDAKFPDYQKVIPQNNDKIMEIQIASFLEELNAIGVITKGKGVKMNISKSAVILEGSGPDGSTSKSELPCNFAGADKISAIYNPSFISDALTNLQTTKADTVRVSFSEPSSPTMLQSENDQNCCYVVMPMKGDT